MGFWEWIRQIMDKVINKASRGSEVPLGAFLCEVGVLCDRALAARHCERRVGAI